VKAIVLREPRNPELVRVCFHVGEVRPDRDVGQSSISTTSGEGKVPDA